MAAVTVASGYPRFVVNGHMREWLYKFDLANNGDYLDVPLKKVLDGHLTDNSVTAIGITSVTQSGTLSRVVFNSGGALNNCYARFIGW